MEVCYIGFCTCDYLAGFGQMGGAGQRETDDMRAER